jgi:exoribonuclease R
MAASRVVRVTSSDDGVAAHELREGIARIQQELEVTPEFPPEVLAAAEAAARSPRWPDLNRTDIPMVTIDPPQSMDLDQAMHIEREGDGYVVYYAIADLAAFITPGDPIDVEAHKRGQTLYGADSKVPLHPGVISEGAASLLPDQECPALLWTIKVDATGEGTDVTVERARVRSRAKLSYEGVQQAFDDGTADEPQLLLKEVGELRLAREAARGGVSLPLPEQEVSVEGEHWHLRFRAQLPTEQWNAQISLLTGMAAASLMVDGRVGLLRTLPPADPRDIQRLHRTAQALGIDWPAEMPYPDFIRSLDPTRSSHAAMVTACARLFRGSGYVGFAGEVPEQRTHAALASEYAHVTAPLRRLGDRYAGEICLALCAGQDVPDWVLERLDELPETMQRADQMSHRYEGAIVDLVEAGVLRDRMGERFEGVVVEVDAKDERRGTITVQDPAIEAPITSRDPVPLGDEVAATLATADLGSRSVVFTLETRASEAD